MLHSKHLAIVPTQLSETERLQPLSSEERHACETLVEEFLLDHDPNGILPIRPDMRLIQECFRLLKSQVGKRKNSQMAKIYGNTKSIDESAMAQLVARREAEISKPRLCLEFDVYVQLNGFY